MRFQVYERVEIQPFEGYESAGKSVHCAMGKDLPKGLKAHLKAVTKPTRLTGLVTYSYFKDGAFTTVEGDAAL